MDTKITLELKEDKSKVEYEPELSAETFVPLINTALNTMPNSLLQMFSTIPLLRPACAREYTSHTYVFSEGERGKVENDLYKYRKHLYDTTAAIFSEVLSAAFPDIEYIETCRQYQQEYCMTHNEEETKEFMNEVNEVVTYVRENFDEVLKEVTEHDEQKEETKS